jgi:hypothetical protein
MRFLSLLIIIGLGSSCITVPITETLKPGQKEVTATFGGPLIALPGGGPTIALPSITAEYRQGGGDHWDWHAGTHLLPTAFGAMGAHGGVSYRLLKQLRGRPRLIITDRLYLFSNHLDDRKPSESKGFWLSNELTLTAAWARGKATYYVSLIDHLDLALPGFLITPAIGAKYQRNKWTFFGELRWFGANADNSKAALAWEGFGDYGAQGIGLGISRQFGGQ